MEINPRPIRSFIGIFLFLIFGVVFLAALSQEVRNWHQTPPIPVQKQ